MEKYFNNAIIGNSNILGCITDRGELIRLYYPNIDYFQNIDMYNYGIIFDNKVKWLSDANLISQYYDTNILYTELESDNVKVIQKDYVLSDKNILVRKLAFNKNVDLFLYSRLNSNVNRLISGMVVQDTLMQYCQEFYMSTFSNKGISNYQINNANFDNFNLDNRDYVGMSPSAAIKYDNINEITLYVSFERTLHDALDSIENIKNVPETKLCEKTKQYWNKYINDINVKEIQTSSQKEKDILIRTAYMFSLLTNKNTGGVLASPDVDETFSKCGRYGYCWPRDALFIMKAFALLGMNEQVERFYNVWATKAQLNSGLFEQRYYVNGELAPSWGLQIDETAAMLIGINKYGKCRKLENVIVKATEALLGFLDDRFVSKECYDLWEERKGTHLYSTASIYEALNSSKDMLHKIDRIKYKNIITTIEKILPKINTAIKNLFVENNKLKRSVDNTQIDMSLLSVVTPFNIFEINDPLVTSAVNDIETRLKLPNGGYMRYEGDAYMGGNAWIISSLWLSLYYIKAGNKERAKELFDWVTNHADNLNFLPEQIDRNSDRTAWVVQLAWSHAMYVIVRNELKE
ncbi:MAG: hypothetical protein J6B87_02345 [Clostridia bacterium]|nr:hypothetical protein [Clostridia bacterium]